MQLFLMLIIDFLSGLNYLDNLILKFSSITPSLIRLIILRVQISRYVIIFTKFRIRVAFLI